MKPILVLAALLCAVVPTSAQSKVYTNADLTSKPVTFTRSVTPEEWSGLQARAFVAPPELLGPTVYVAPWSGDRPGFLPDNNAVVMAASRAVFDADDLWRDPVTAYALQHPIEAAYGVTFRQPRYFTRSTPGVPPIVRPSMPTAPIATPAAGAGRRVR